MTASKPYFLARPSNGKSVKESRTAPVASRLSLLAGAYTITALPQSEKLGLRGGVVDGEAATHRGYTMAQARAQGYPLACNKARKADALT